MSALQRIGARLDSLARQLDDPIFEPDTDVEQGDRTEELEDLRDQIEAGIIDERDGAQQEIESTVDPEHVAFERSRLDLEIGLLAAEVAVVHWVAGDDAGAGELMSRAVELLPEGEVREELLAGQRDMASFTVLTRARWLQRHSEFAVADDVVKKNMKKISASAEPLRVAAQRLLETPRPLKGPPSLSTINGIGFGLYGRRDEAPDGTYVATHCFCLLFIPLLPIAAYRVFNHGDGSYTFYAKLPLSGFARGFRWALLAAFVMGLAGWAISGYLNSPERLLSNAVAEARELEQAGQTEQALAEYDDILNRFSYEVSDSALSPIASSIMSLVIGGVEEPMTADRVDQASRVVTRYRSLHRAAQGGEALTQLTTALDRWTEQVGHDNLENAQASLRLLQLAEEIARGNALKKARERGRATHLAVAQKLVKQWPVEALEHYVAALPMAEARTASEPVVRLVSKSPSLIDENQKVLRSWLDDARGATGSQSLAQELGVKLQHATSYVTNSDRQKALESGEESLLRAALEQEPGDHEAAAALSDALRGQGDLQGAIKVLTDLGPPGQVSTKAQRTLASCYVESGELDQADQILDRFVSRRLPPYQAARRRYDAKLRSTMDSLLGSLRRGAVPSTLESQLIGVSEAEQQVVVEGWIKGQIAGDRELERLRAEMEQYGEVVPSALSLGMVKLRRASEVSGDERQALLAAAERLFLAIREEAEGVPAYHLGLGQVYYRLGRSEDGERELQGVLARNDPELSVQVAHAYRELRLVTKARQVAEGIWEQGEVAGSKARGNAAALMGVMSIELDERELWLKRAPQDNPFIRTSLMEVRASRAYRDGQFQQADRLFAEAAEEHLQGAAHNAAAANNSAIATQSRYGCTGSQNHLQAAVEGLEQALRLQPDSTLTTMNLAGLLEYQAQVKVLDQQLRTTVLRPDASSAYELLGLITDGPHRQSVLEALRRDPGIRRSLELTRQSQVLAPSDMASYSAELRWYVLQSDIEGMRDLHRRVELVERFDTSQIEQRRATNESTENDERRLNDFAEALTIADAALDRARRSRHAPTIAASLATKGSILDSRVVLSGNADDARAAIAAFREAHEAWGELGVESQLAWALVRLAVIELDEVNTLAAAWRNNRRRYPLSTLLYRVVSAEGGSAVISALRERAEIREAAALLRAGENRAVRSGDWIIGRISGDEELQRLGAEWIRRDSSRIMFEIGLRLDPTNPTNDDHRRIREEAAAEASSS